MCVRPLTAWQLDSGEVVWAERGKVRRELSLPCGQRVECRLKRSRQWAIRIMHESQLHEVSSFVTLTYDDAHCPDGLRYHDYQLFMRRLRKKFPRVKFFMCGEYGEKTRRPHYHACLFGVGFSDRVVFKRLGSGYNLYESALLNSLWTDGFASVGDLSFDSAAYVARYCMKKATGYAAEMTYCKPDLATGELISIAPEFARMSLRNAIGKEWLERFKSDVFPRDYVVMNGVKHTVPKYYDKWLREVDPEMAESLEFGREQKRLAYSAENREDRLRAREAVTRARLVFKSRVLE